MIEDLTPAEVNKIILAAIPSVIATLAARIHDPSGELLGQTVQEQVAFANQNGMTGVEFGLIKLQAAERVGVWLLNTLSAAVGSSVDDLMLLMLETAAEEGIVGFFDAGDGPDAG